MNDIFAGKTSTDDALHDRTARLNMPAVAVACSLVWGIGVFVLSWWVRLFSNDDEAPLGLGRVYPGFRATAMGSVIGGFWALLDGFLAGWSYAWLYNWLRDRFAASPADTQPLPEGGE